MGNSLKKTLGELSAFTGHLLSLCREKLGLVPVSGQVTSREEAALSQF